MKIAVCVKQVPDTNEVKIDPETNTLIRKGVPSILNPFDEYALELALQLKEKVEGSTVTVITMGPDQAKDVLKQAYAMGGDEMVLITDRKFGGADTLATSYTLYLTIQELGGFDIIFCGKQAIDGDTAQVGPELAEHLGIPQITYALEIDYQDDQVVIKRENDDMYDMMTSELPMLVTVTKPNFDPRSPNILRRLKANKEEIREVTFDDLPGANPEHLGLKGSPTRVRKIFAPPKKTGGIKLEGYDTKEAVSLALEKMHTDKVFS